MGLHANWSPLVWEKTLRVQLNPQGHFSIGKGDY